MKVVLIIAHNSARSGAFRGFEAVLDRLHHDMPGTRVASTSLVDLDSDLRAILREDVDSVTLVPYLLLQGHHASVDIPTVVAEARKDFPQIPVTLLPCIGEWNDFIDMLVSVILKASGERPKRKSFAPEGGESSPRKSSLFAVEMNLEGRNVLVVGGGRIAFRKVKTLLPTGARITVVAPQIDPEFKKLADSIGTDMAPIQFCERSYESLDLRGVFMVFICSDQPVVNAQVSNDARARRILVNNACDYLDGDFIVPARMDFGQNITVTVSTQGKSPSLAKQLKQKILTEWGPGLEKVERDFAS